MCGIVGFTNHSSSYDKKLKIKKMADLIQHRGPDDEGFYIDDHIALGMRRLSIIDVAGGQQPIFNEDRSKVIVFNGEIYNYKEIQKDLISKGHTIRTNGDTETIIHAYEEYGVKCLNHLNGMFAFAIWDIREQKLFIARDRLGVKPVHYYYNNGRFIFGSEIKSILTVPEVSRTINETAVLQFLKYYYIPGTNTIFENIYKLLPGHYLTYSPQSMQLNIQKYWDIDEQKVLDISYDEAKIELRNKLTKAVDYRLMSEVPLGTFLSGGIDSSTITGIMASLSDKPVKTFTIGYKDYPVYDESELARKVSKAYNTDHHELFLDFNDIEDVVKKIVWDLDEPFADSSAIPTYYVSKMAREHVTVALSGDGGDELFAGYEKYTSVYYNRMYRKIPNSVRNHLIEPIVNQLPSGRGNQLQSFGRKAKKFLRSSNQAPATSHLKLMESFSDEFINTIRLAQPNNHNFIDDFSEHYNHFNRDQVTNMMYTDLKFALPNDMLTKVDRMSMLNSLEVRSPFLDYQLVEFAFQLPIEYKIKGLNKKIILKDAFKDMLPIEVLRAPKKGFGIPVGEWFKKELRGLLERYLSKSNIERVGVFDYNIVNQLIKVHTSNKQDHTNLIWSLLVFHMWYDTCM